MTTIFFITISQYIINNIVGSFLSRRHVVLYACIMYVIGLAEQPIRNGIYEARLQIVLIIN